MISWEKVHRKELTNPLVSIVTPSYNQGRFIQETIESVLSQDYSPIEYMIIDGQSTDETCEILKSYQDRFFWISEKDRGQAHAINKGWRRSRGEILAWLNSDDVYLPGAVSKAVTFLANHQEVGAIYGEGYHIEADGQVMERYPTEPYDSNRLAETCIICQPTVFIRRSVLDEIGFLDETLQYCMDYDFWFRISKKFTWGYLSEYLASTRFYSQTKTLGQRVKVHKEILQVVYRHNGYVPPSWIYGYSHAFWENYFERTKPLENSLFIIGLILLSMEKFMVYNRRVPASEWRRWWNWLTAHLSWKSFFPPRGK